MKMVSCAFSRATHSHANVNANSNFKWIVLIFNYFIYNFVRDPRLSRRIRDFCSCLTAFSIWDVESILSLRSFDVLNHHNWNNNSGNRTISPRVGLYVCVCVCMSCTQEHKSNSSDADASLAGGAAEAIEKR